MAMQVAKTDKTDKNSSKTLLTAVNMTLQKQFAQMGNAVSKHISQERAFMFCVHSVRNSPKLLECSPQSIATSMIAIALMGLECGVSKEAYIVPFWNKKLKSFEATPITGYQGDIKNIYRFKLDKSTPLVKDLMPYTVCQNDTFKVYGGSDARIVHEIDYLKPRGIVVAFYAIARLSGGGELHSVMSKEDVLNHANKFSKSKDKEGKLYGPWIDNFDSMAHKTVIHSIKKLLPSSYVDTGFVDTDVFDNQRVVFNEELNQIEPVSEELEADINIEETTTETKKNNKKTETKKEKEIDFDPETGELIDPDESQVIEEIDEDGKDEFEGLF